MNDIKYYLGQRIKELRKIKGLSQQELAEIANIDQRSLSHIECGDTFPSKSLFELAEALDVDLKDLFDFEHLKNSRLNMKASIIENLDSLSDENIKILYRLIKSMK